jgi:hypothetical protein
VKSATASMLLAIMTLIASNASAQTLSIGSETIGSSGIATVDLNISGLTPGTTAIGTYDVNVGFNSSVVNFASAAFGDPVLGSDQLDPEGYGTFSTVTSGAGTAELFELSLDDPAALLASQPSSFTLATMSFDAVGTGTSVLALSVNALGDQTGNSVSAALQNGSITVTGGGGGGGGGTPAPEMDATSASGALTLLLGGLIVLRARRSGSLARL